MHYDTLILGAGAAGLFCAGRLRGRTLIVDHARAPGEKIRISGGGRCNFTNMYCGFENFLGQNPHFHKSALSRYTQWDFIELVDRHKIPWHEKTLGQLFCDSSSKDIIALLLAEASKADLWLQTDVGAIRHDASLFHAQLTREGQTIHVTARHLVLATGGKSIPKMGATGLAYQLATQFGMRVTDTAPALVPFTFSDQRFAPLSGTAVPVRATAKGTSFDEAMLFTHRGLSGPAILQISSYWTEGEDITLQLLPDTDLFSTLRAQRQKEGRKALKTHLSDHLPSRLVDHLAQTLPTTNLADLSDTALQDITDNATRWTLRPTGTEGYRKAEVTRGGIDTNDLNSTTMMSKTQTNLFAIGEAVDVTGWLGGFNFQWAWSSGAAAAEAINNA